MITPAVGKSWGLQRVLTTSARPSSILASLYILKIAGVARAVHACLVQQTFRVLVLRREGLLSVLANNVCSCAVSVHCGCCW